MVTVIMCRSSEDPTAMSAQRIGEGMRAEGPGSRGGAGRCLDTVEKDMRGVPWHEEKEIRCSIRCYYSRQACQAWCDNANC